MRIEEQSVKKDEQAVCWNDSSPGWCHAHSNTHTHKHASVGKLCGKLAVRKCLLTVVDAVENEAGGCALDGTNTGARESAVVCEHGASSCQMGSWVEKQREEKDTVLGKSGRNIERLTFSVAHGKDVWKQSCQME